MLSRATDMRWGCAVEPISMALLAALAGGAGGEAGKQAWTALGALVRRPFRTDRPEADHPPAEAELVALERAPMEPDRAQALAEALGRRAAAEPEFAAALRAWVAEADPAPVRNVISGGVQHGPVIQGRDFHGPITFR